MLPDEWPLPTALPLDECIRSLTEITGYYIEDDDFDIVFASEPAAVARWISAAGRYAAVDYALHILQRLLDWTRDEVAPKRGVSIDDVARWADALHTCLTAHRSLLENRDNALKEFERACIPLREGLLFPTNIAWQDARLAPHGLSSAHDVFVPAATGAPWPLVKVYRSTVEHLADVSVPPEPTRPAVRRTAYGFERVDHTGQRRRLLPTADDRYLLHGFAWRSPADPDATQRPRPIDRTDPTIP